MTQEVCDFLVCCDEAAERGKRLRESAHDELDIVGNALSVADAAAAGAEHRYEFLGISFYASGDAGGASFDFICRDKEDGTVKNIAFEKEQSVDEFLQFFKRFNVVLGLRHQYEKLDEVENPIETIYVDDRDE